MNILVFEQHDGIAYDSFIKTTDASISIKRDGITGTVNGVTLRKLTREDRPYYTRPVPVNYKTITRDQAIKALEACKYGYEIVSMTGTELQKHFNLDRNKQYGVNHG